MFNNSITESFSITIVVKKLYQLFSFSDENYNINK